MGWTNDLKIGGSTRVDIDSTFTQGIVLPTLREETCLAPTNLTKTINMTPISSSDISEGESTEDFEGTEVDNGDTDTGGTYFSVMLDTTSDLEIYDINASELFPTSWCTTYSTTITNITPGKVLPTGTFCYLLFDDTERYIDF